MAMSMPQVHLVAYCGDLGYGVAIGTQILSLMLGLGVVSRLASGFVADKIGAGPMLILGSAMQATALLLYLFFNSLILALTSSRACSACSRAASCRCMR